MIEAEPVRLGPFLLPVTTLALALLVWLSARAADRLLPEDKARWSERFLGAFLMYFILYEISPLFTDPLSTLRHPSAILYLSGSPKGAMIAGGITAVYLTLSFSAPSNPPFPGAGCGGSRRPFHRHRLFDHFSKLGKANRSALGYNHRGGGKGSSDSPIPPPAPFRHSVLVVAWSKPFASRGNLRMGVPGGRDRSSDHILF